MENDKKIDSKDIGESLDRLIASMDKLTEIQRKIEKHNRLFPTIVRAIAYALGSTLGLAIVISIIFYLLRSIGLFDNLSNVINNLNEISNI